MNGRRAVLRACALAMAWGLAAPFAAAQAVVLSPAEAPPGSQQTLRFHVPDACGGPQRTRAVSIELPWRFRLLRALPREGWEASMREAVNKNGPLGLQGAVSWRPVPGAWAPAGDGVLDFALEARMPPGAASAPFAVVQHCDDGARTERRAVLRVLPPGPAPVRVSGAWVRTTSGPARDSDLFLVLQAESDLRLVGAHSPRVARIALQRTLLGKLQGAQVLPTPQVDLPAGRRVALVPGVASLGLWQIDGALAEGDRLPVTLRFEDAAGVLTEQALEVPVHAVPPVDAHARP